LPPPEENQRIDPSTGDHLEDRSLAWQGLGLAIRKGKEIFLNGTDHGPRGILGREGIRMRTALRGLALTIAIGLLQACGGGAPAPGASTTGDERGVRAAEEEPTEEIAGAVASLGSEEESGGHFATMADMLRGRVPGLQVSQDATGEIMVRIRGDQSILFNGPPLLVVDGMPVPAYSFSSTLRSMNPRDVANIRVLKDTGSTSAYGMRGAHGVILITLKRG
jgi:TonB-dependent SusC/RagA subfamily outer membrane receptor